MHMRNMYISIIMLVLSFFMNFCLSSKICIVL